jgi:hypothetical protein
MALDVEETFSHVTDSLNGIAKGENRSVVQCFIQRDSAAPPAQCF